MRPDEPLDEETTHEDRGRHGWRPGVVGLALLGLIVALLIGAFLANQQLRPQVGVDPVPLAPATAKPTGGPSGFSAPTLPPATAPATAAARTPSSTAGPGVLGVGSSPLEREVEAAYLKYWERRAEALLNLDSSRLSEVMAGPELQRAQDQIADLKARERAAKIVVEHRIAFVRVTEQSAELYDEYVNKSYLVDPNTKQPVGTPGPGGVAKVSYQLEKAGGVWRVVDGTQHE